VIVGSIKEVHGQFLNYQLSKVGVSRAVCSGFHLGKRTLAIFQARVCYYRLNEGNLLQDVFGASSGVFATAFVTLAFVLTGLVVFLLSAFFFIGLNDTSIFQFVKGRFIYFFNTFAKNLCSY